VAYVPGLVMRRAADLYPGEAKTDKRDAYLIADTGRTRRKQVHWLDAGSDELLDRLRVLNGFDIDLAADQTRLANRCRDAVTSVSPGLERALGARLHLAGVRDLLAKYPTLTAQRAAGRARITRTVKARSPRLATKIVDAVMAAIDAQTVTVPAEATIGRVIAELVVELDRVFARRERLAAEIEEAFLAHPFGELLSSMPGIGPRTGSRILAEIGDGTRFADGDKLTSYAGLAPVTRQSGKSINGESKTREGNHRLKNAMFLSAFASLRSPDSKAFYDRRRAPPGPYPAVRSLSEHTLHAAPSPHSDVWPQRRARTCCYSIAIRIQPLRPPRCSGPKIYLQGGCPASRWIDLPL
jgi:transposase